MGGRARLVKWTIQFVGEEDRRTRSGRPQACGDGTKGVFLHRNHGVPFSRSPAATRVQRRKGERAGCALDHLRHLRIQVSTTSRPGK
jgi:hypothetical protein